MYLVTVIGSHGIQVDSRAFPFGSWNEIGLWLDLHGYNDDGYELKVQFGTFGS